MGNCFQPALKGSGITSHVTSKTRAGHMGPDGVESSIFAGKGEPYPTSPITQSNFKQNPPPQPHPAAASAATRQPDAAAAGPVLPPAPPNDKPDDPFSLTVEMAPLDKLHDGEQANGAPHPGNGASEAAKRDDPHADSNGSPQKKPQVKQAVMRRSFPPVGVVLVLEEQLENVAPNSQASQDFQDNLAGDIATSLNTEKDRIRIISLNKGSVVVNLNIVADRTDNDPRSPMQLAAELVQQAKKEGSTLKQKVSTKNVKEARIAEDPFPGKKQDWAGGIAMLRPPAANKPAQGKPNKNDEKTQASPAPGGSSAAPPPEAPKGIDPAALKAANNTSELPEGVLPIDDGFYAGELQTGNRHGRGKQHYSNGDVYVGCFKDDKRHGIGRLTLSQDAGTYLGEWLEDARNGKGSWTYPNKDVYVGSWKNDLRDGEGRLVMASGAWYKGEFKLDKMHGKGLMQMANKDIYEGEFHNDQMHGQGVYTTSASGEPASGWWCLGERLSNMSDDEARKMCAQKAAEKPLTPGTTGQSAVPQGNGSQPNAKALAIDGLQDASDSKHSIPSLPANRPPNQAPPASQPAQRAEPPHKGAGAPMNTMAKGSNINEAKPPARPQRTGATMKTDETLKLASEKLFHWANADGERKRDEASQ